MSFYELKRKALSYIEGFIKEGTNTRPGIIIDVQRLTGFGKKFVNNYIDDLIKANIVAENDDVLKWIKIEEADKKPEAESVPRD